MQLVVNQKPISDLSSRALHQWTTRRYIKIERFATQAFESAAKPQFKNGISRKVSRWYRSSRSKSSLMDRCRCQVIFLRERAQSCVSNSLSRRKITGVLISASKRMVDTFLPQIDLSLEREIVPKVRMTIVTGCHLVNTKEQRIPLNDSKNLMYQSNKTDQKRQGHQQSLIS